MSNCLIVKISPDFCEIFFYIDTTSGWSLACLAGSGRGYPVHPKILKILIQTLVVCGRGHPAHPKIL